jgi:hypothetical protein
MASHQRDRPSSHPTHLLEATSLSELRAVMLAKRFEDDPQGRATPVLASVRADWRRGA